MLETTTLRTGTTCARDEAEAAREIWAEIGQTDGAHVLLCSSSFDLQRLGRELCARFGDRAIGCTSLGEIDSSGYLTNSIVGFSIGPEYGTSTLFHLDLDATLPEQILRVREQVRAVSQRDGAPAGEKAFGILLVDGLSRAEEVLISGLQAALPEVPITGGSASENLEFQHTHVLGHEGFRSGRAALLVVHTTAGFHRFNSHHFKTTDHKLVITGAIPDQRLVTEINGRPAAPEYARIIGIARENLAPATFSDYPFLLKMAGSHYVRAVQRVNDDDSLTFFCAIEEGLVLSMGTPHDYLQVLDEALRSVELSLPGAEVIFGVECVLRRFEVVSKGLEQQVGARMRQHHVVGFHSYGEQFDGLHVNQTLTGIALKAD